jgi:hypothetical protein
MASEGVVKMAHEAYGWGDHGGSGYLLSRSLTHGAVPYNSIGAELVTDGGMETWASATNLTNWVEYLAGTSTVNREGADKHGGTYSCRLDVDASNSQVRINNSASIVLTAGGSYKLSLWYKTSAGKTAKINLTDTSTTTWLDSTGAWGEYTWIALPAVTDWTEYTIYFPCPSGYTNFILYLDILSAASSSVYYDDVSIKPTGALVDSPVTTDGTIVNVASLVSYANDAAAGIGGLVAGDLYTETGTDPLRLAVKS